MGRSLRLTVVSGGVSYPAGTPATPDLEALITNPAAWTGAPDPAPAKPAPAVEPGPAASAPRKPRRTRKT